VNQLIMSKRMGRGGGRERERERQEHMMVYPKVSELAAWSDNCKWYSSLPQGAVVSLFCESV
jgi:hypothetical protein